MEDGTKRRLSELGIAEHPATMSVREAGELVGLSRSAAYRAAACGDLPTIRFGGRLFVPTRQLLDLLGIKSPKPVTTAAARD